MERNTRRLDADQFNTLLKSLRLDGYQLIGPRVRDKVIVYDEVESLDDFPIGISDRQEAGTYRLEKTEKQAVFDYAVGPHSWKQFLFPARVKVWTGEREGNDMRFSEPDSPPPRYAFIGVRSCELHAIAIQDKIFLEGTYVDSNYSCRRENAFIVAVNCSKAAATCFCSSMGCGPKVESGFDLCLTEVFDEGRQYFVMTVGSELGARFAEKLETEKADQANIAAAEKVVQSTAAQMKRSVDTKGLKELIYRSLESPAWEEIGSRCLSCTNCTMVCPTCFCSSVEDVTELDGKTSTRTRNWDSCFSLDFSHVHGGSVRRSIGARYRQWLSHKFASWIDQFGTSGCVGCGRCIAWCPVGIDVTEELRGLRKLDEQNEKEV